MSSSLVTTSHRRVADLPLSSLVDTPRKRKRLVRDYSFPIAASEVPTVEQFIVPFDDPHAQDYLLHSMEWKQQLEEQQLKAAAPKGRNAKRHAYKRAKKTQAN